MECLGNFCSKTPEHPMAIAADALEALLREAFTDADIRIDDLAGDGDHYRAVIKSDAFVGKSRVAQHQMVYAALKGRMGGELHALALETGPKSGT
jgi:stress-induced morphogen